MNKSFITKFLSVFLSMLMLFSMIPQVALADTSPVVPDNYTEVEEALRSTTPTTIEINGYFTLNNEVIVGANHTLSITSGSAIYLAGNCKLNIPAGVDLTVNGGGKLICHDTSIETILLEGTLNLNGIYFEVYSERNQINGKLTATDCNITISNASGLGIVLLGELEITGGRLDIKNTGDFTTGIVSFSSNPLSILDCEVKLNSDGNDITAIQGDMFVKDSNVSIDISGDYGAIGISYREKLIFDNSTVMITNKYQSTGIHSYGGYGNASEFKIINGSKIQVKNQGLGTGIFIAPVVSAPTSLIIDHSILELYPGGYALDFNNGTEILGNNYGKIIFYEGSKVYGISNKIKDRDVIVDTSYSITVGPQSAPAAKDAISAGTYTWEGTHFSNTTVLPTDISFTASQTGGASGTKDSIGINIVFSKDVIGFTEDKISITDGTGAAVKGVLSGSGNSYIISLTSVTAQGTINVAIADFGNYKVKTSPQTINVYKNNQGNPNPVDKTALIAKIMSAHDAKRIVSVSTDGSDVNPSYEWVTQVVIDNFYEAIRIADIVMLNINATQKEVDDATKALDDAINIFNLAKKPGTKSTNVPNPEPEPEPKPNPPKPVEPTKPTVPTNPVEPSKHSESVEDIFVEVARHWAINSIQFVYDRGLMTGTSKNTFSPNSSMIRGMLITALGRLANADISNFKSSSFNDVDINSYYGAYAEWSYKNNITKGTGNNNFSPEKPITREELAIILVNFAKVMGYKLPSETEVNSFADDSTISSLAKEAIQILQSAGVVQGNQNNNFNPKAFATRAEIATVLQRFIELLRL